MAKQHFIWLAPVCSVLFFLLLQYFNVPQAANLTACVTLLTVLWWVTEALPIPVTSLVPFVLLPSFGILSHKAAASALGSHVILLLMGAFILSKAVEKSQLHERLALHMLHLVGLSSGKRLVFAFMLATAVLSMWISNTATTLIMLPIALAITHRIKNPDLITALLLGIAYAASVGGIATPVGTPPNLIFMGIYQETFKKSISFIEWMQIALPVVIITIPLIALWLTRHINCALDIELPHIGAWSVAEKRVFLVFGITILLWITRTAPFGGWAELIGNKAIGDSTIALAAVVAMFAISDGKQGKLLDWQTAQSIPWGMLLLFAGGIAIAKGFVASGLSSMLGDALANMMHLTPLLMLLVICLFVTYLTEITSNTATSTLLLPILAASAVAMQLDPKLLMIPATLCASCAFMLPVATAPNAIVYGSEQIEMKTMVREGALLSVLTAVTVTAVSYVFLA